MKLALISGSLRAASYNTMVLNTLEPLFGDEVTCVRVDIDLPLYNEDLETEDALPEKVKALREAIKNADGVIICTPEYNYAIPGTVKNTLDWVSRPPGRNLWKNKPLAVIGASPSFTGTARSQQMTKTCFLMVAARIFTSFDVLIASAHERFDAGGQLTDEDTRVILSKFAAKFSDFVRN